MLDLMGRKKPFAATTARQRQQPATPAPLLVAEALEPRLLLSATPR